MYDQQPVRQEQAVPIPFEDRRVFMRFSMSLPVKFFCPDPSVSGKGQLRDISASGLGFLTNKRLHVYTRMDINVMIPQSDKPFYSKGEVMWVERIDFDMYRVGIKLDTPELMGVWRVLNGASARPSEAGAGHSEGRRQSGLSRGVKFIQRLLHLKA